MRNPRLVSRSGVSNARSCDRGSRFRCASYLVPVVCRASIEQSGSLRERLQAEGMRLEVGGMNPERRHGGEEGLKSAYV